MGQQTLEHPGGALAVFDAAVVSNLTGHVDDATIGFVFASRFRELLPHRLWRIAQALGAGDRDEALDAVLSLKVSAATLGAREVSALAAAVEGWLRADDLTNAAGAAATLSSAASRLEDALADFLAL